ncbi:unannotated protein [freshwater metagenome]|uniref:Unannotated protein n=1 Tax=freshwater metagenome TaxID=449393 RepID=A0A6J7FLD1_9ZZZZ|nr:hypothetical protein [Actinomycetota bacterium]
MSHPHLTPEADAAADPEGVAVLAFDSALREGIGPRAAMRRAFRAAGVDTLEARFDEAADRIADLERFRLDIHAAVDAHEDAPTATDSVTRRDPAARAA